jgi:2-haloacid dehalogenase
MTATTDRAIDLVLFDVNGTLSDMEPLRELLVSVGAPGHILDTWFTSVLRDGFALTMTDAAVPFPKVAASILCTVLAPVLTLQQPVDTVVEKVLAAFPKLPVHRDIAEGMKLLASAGVQLATLTNGSALPASQMLDKAELGVYVHTYRRLTVDDAPGGRWKPHADAYLYAANACGVPLKRIALVAVHPWDIAGAKAVGMRTGFIHRSGISTSSSSSSSAYPDVFPQPDVMGGDLPAVAKALLALK